MWNTFEGLIPWEIKIKSTLICYKQVKFEIQKYNTITIFFINIVAFRLRAKSRDPFTSGRKVSSWYFGFDIVESSSFLKRGAIIRLIPKVSSRDTFPWDGIRCRTRSAKHFEGAKTGAGNIICRELAPTFLPIPCAPSCSLPFTIFPSPRAKPKLCYVLARYKTIPRSQLHLTSSSAILRAPSFDTGFRNGSWLDPTPSAYFAYS